MKFTTLTIVALGFTGFTVGQLETAVSSVNCINLAFCTTGTPTRSKGYTAPTTDSTDLTRTITEHRRQVPPSSDCTSITSIRSDLSKWATPVSTHIQCGPDISKPTCSTSYECGCKSSHFTREGYPETHLCYPTQEVPISSQDFGGGRSQPGRWVVREAKETKAPKQTWTRTSRRPIAARATSQDFGGGRSQRRVAREAELTAVEPCDPGYFGPGCLSRPTGSPANAIEAREAVAPRCEPGKFGPGCFPIITHPPANAIEAREARATSICSPGHVGPECRSFLRPLPLKSTRKCPPGWFGPDCPPQPWAPANTLEARQEPNKPHVCIGDECTISFFTPVPTPAPTTTSWPHCPPGECGPACRQGLYCNKQFGRVASQDLGGRSQRRVAREAEQTSSPIPTATTTSHFGCPSGVCGPGCRWGHECDMLFGCVTSQDFGGGRSQRRVVMDAEATAVAEVVHSTLLTLRA